MPSKRNIALGIVILLIVIVIVLLQNPFQISGSGEFGIIEADNTGINIGDLAPDFVLQSLEGEEVRLSDLRGKKAVVVNFWATWCPPCREEMPAFEQIFRENKDSLEILGINLQENKDTINQFLNEIPVTYPLLLDPTSEVKRAYNIFTQPVTYFLDKEGRIVDKKFGLLTPEEIDEKFNKLIEVSHIEIKTEDEIKTLADGTKYIIHPDKFLSGGPPKDGIPSIDNPKFITPEEADWLPNEEIGLGIVYKGEARFYPFRILVSHELVNDKIQGDPILISYCPLCFTGIAFLRELDGEPVEFGVSGKLYNSELVMYDRKTDSYWPQTLGKAVLGPSTGTVLKKLVSDTVQWGDWKKANPDTKVLSRKTGFLRVYNGNNPYGENGNFESINLQFPLQNKDSRIDQYAIVYGIEINNLFKAYKKSDLAELGSIQDSLGGEKIIVTFDETLKSARAKTESGEDIVVETLFWFAWAAFHPDTGLYQ